MAMTPFARGDAHCPLREPKATLTIPAGIITERKTTDGCVVDAGDVMKERLITVGRVSVASGVAIKRLNAIRRVNAALGVVKECTVPTGRIGTAVDIVKEYISTGGGVANAGDVAEERLITDGRVDVSSGVSKERAFLPMAVLAPPVELAKEGKRSIGRVGNASRVAQKRSPRQWPYFRLQIFNARVPAPTPVLKPPPLRVLSDNEPTAVFAEPVVRLKGPFVPSAVLKPG